VPGTLLQGELCVPSLPHGPRGLILLATATFGKPIGRLRLPAPELFKNSGFATLELGLLGESERESHERETDVPFLSARIAYADNWIQHHPSLRVLPLGILAREHAAASAFWSAAELGPRVSAIVSIEGRPELALARLRAVGAPALLIVSARDRLRLEATRRALARLDRGRLAVMEGDLPEEASALALEWFWRYLVHGGDARFAA
jgi:putative phosphoribosyl transferase